MNFFSPQPQAGRRLRRRVRRSPQIPRRHLNLAPQATAPKPDAAKTEGQAATGADEAPPPYEPELLRLSEILGALTYLRGYLPAIPMRRAGAAGCRRFSIPKPRPQRARNIWPAPIIAVSTVMKFPTGLAPRMRRVIIKRFLAEGEKIAHDVANRYGAS